MNFLEWIENLVVVTIGCVPLLLMGMLLMSTAVYTLGYIYDIIFGNWIIKLGHKIGKKYYKIKNVSIIRKIWSLMQPKECYLRYATPVISYCFSYMAVSLLKLFIPTRNANISYIEAALVYIILYFVGLKRKYGKNDKKIAEILENNLEFLKVSFWLLGAIITVISLAWTIMGESMDDILALYSIVDNYPTVLSNALESSNAFLQLPEILFSCLMIFILVYIFSVPIQFVSYFMIKLINYFRKYSIGYKKFGKIYLDLIKGIINFIIK